MTQTTVLAVTADQWTEVLPTNRDGVLFVLTTAPVLFCAAPDANSCSADAAFTWDRTDELRVPALQGGARLYARATQPTYPVRIARLAPVSLSGGEASGTRAYNWGAATRTGVAATSSGATAIGALAPSREVLLVASTRCHVRFGDANLPAAAAEAGCLPLPADTLFHLRLPPTVTHLRVVRDSSDGHLSVVPVA